VKQAEYLAGTPAGVQPYLGTNVMNKLTDLARAWAAEDDGAQVIEYALIIAVVAIALIIALRGLVGSNILGFIARVDACLLNSTCT
jgi:pilus assembly protein Flp/PilA